MEGTPSDLPLGLSQTTWMVIGAIGIIVVLVLVYVMFFREEEAPKAAEKKESMSDSDKLMLRRIVDLNRTMNPRNSMAATRESMVDPMLVAAAMRS